MHPPRTATPKLQHDSCATFFPVAMHRCRGIPDTVSHPFLQGCRCTSCLYSSLGGVERKGFPSTISGRKSDQIPHLFSINPSAQRSLPHTPQEQEYNYDQLWHPLLKLWFTPLCHACPPTVFTTTLPKLYIATFQPGKEVLLMFFQISAFSSKTLMLVISNF